MLKKVLLLYKDPDFQQRWISEVVQATGCEEAVVQQTAAELKAKLKRFREWYSPIPMETWEPIDPGSPSPKRWVLDCGLNMGSQSKQKC